MENRFLLFESNSNHHRLIHINVFRLILFSKQANCKVNIDE